MGKYAVTTTTTLAVLLALGVVVGYGDERQKSNASAIITVTAENWISGLHGDKLNWGDKPAKENQGIIQLNAGDTLKAWYDPKAKGRVVAIQVGNANPVAGKNAPPQLPATPDISFVIPATGVVWDLGKTGDKGYPAIKDIHP